MKTRKSITFHSAVRAITILFVLAFAACSSKTGNSGNEKSLQSSTGTKTGPPDMEIHTAALLGDLSAVRQHIKAGSDLNEKDEYGSTPLIIAATFGKTDVVRALVEAGADPNARNNDGGTALHAAAFLCRTEIVKALLENGADKTLKNNFGSTALESISVPFENVKPVYDQFSRDLGPLGLKLDYGRIRSTRPLIADMLR